MKQLKDIVYENGVMPVLFAEEGCASRVINAIEQTEVPVVEILQRGDLAKSVLKEACKIKKNAYVGAGTVCSLEQCKEVVDLGADFVVSPGYNQEMVKWCVKNNIPVVPGVSNTSEVMAAVNTGVTMLKAFPFNELGGAEYFSAIAGPFPDVSFVVTGCLDDRHLSLVSNTRIAAVGGVWMFQAEDDHTVVSEETIIRRLSKSIELGRHYRKGLK